jgi:hypothetical protein
MKRAILIVIALAGLSLAAAGEDRVSSLSFLVTKAENGKPVRNASVILHQVNKDGKQAKGGMQLKTDAEGKTRFDGAPYGVLRVQVIAPGFQTYGEDLEVNQAMQEIGIKLNRPKEQHSIYK